MHEFRPASAVDDDARLAADIGAGDDVAWRTLVDRHVDQVHAHVLRAIDDDPAATRAAVVEVFRSARRDIDTFDPTHGFPMWLSAHVERVVGSRLDDAEIEATWTIRRVVEVVGTDDLGRIRPRVDHVLGDRDLEDVLDEPWVHSRPADDVVDEIVGVHADLEPDQETDDNEGTGLESRPAEGVADRPRRQIRSVVVGVGAAVVALFGGIVLLSALSGNPRPVDVAGDLVPTGEIADVEGSIEITGYDSGIEIELDVVSLPRRSGGGLYRASVLLDDGTVVSAGTFLEGDVLTLRAGVPLERAVEFTISLSSPDESDVAASDGGRVVFKLDLPGG